MSKGDEIDAMALFRLLMLLIFVMPMMMFKKNVIKKHRY